MLFVLSEPLFAAVKIDTDDWDCLISHMTEDQEVLDSTKSFASEEQTPKLFALIPFLENILKLRFLMHSKDLIYCKSLVNEIKAKFMDISNEHNLSSVINEEIKKCELLIRKDDYTKTLNATLDITSVKPYSYDGPNEQPPYSSFCSLEGPIAILRSAIKSFSEIGESFDKNLQKRIDLAKHILEGRLLLNKSESDESINWEESLVHYEDQIFKMCSTDDQKIITHNTDTSDTNDSQLDVFVPYFFIPEYNITVDEFIRRIVLSGLRRILKQTCIDGNVDVDIHVDQSKLKDQFLQFNRLSLILHDKIDVMPENLKNLHSFTSAVLTLRKLVLEKNWFVTSDSKHNADDLTPSNLQSPVKVMLDQLRTMLNGGGLVIPETISEIDLVWKALKAKEFTSSLKFALESIEATIQSESELSYKPQVELSLLNEALIEVRKCKGDYSKKLVSIADKFTSVLDIFLMGKIDSISALDRMNDIIVSCRNAQINSTNIEKVLKVVRTHNFLEFLCETIQRKEKSSDLFKILQQFQVFIKVVPTKFIPWMKTAYHYLEALDASESMDWLRIIECSKNLEENYLNLFSITTSQDIDKKYEDIFLHLIKTKYLYGYNLAINLKAKEEASKEESKSIQPERSPQEIERLRLQQLDSSKLYGVSQLRIAGYSDSDIVNIKIPLKYLWAFNFDPILLRHNGYSAENLKSVGYSTKELYHAGFPVSNLRLTGFNECIFN